ncbi:MAG: hypothetical protein COA91_08025 [Robiginitomaculum sp.]|nr:MAG: hypothetical protein COA91_08025 [Robiginitomaculum sp.]
MWKDHPDTVDAYVGGRLRLLRNSQGKTRADLANRLNISLQRLIDMEKGLERISSERIRKLAQIYNIKPAFFFAGLDNLNAKPPQQ